MILSALDTKDQILEKKRLQRRIYRTKGPNYLLHLDSYDKIKPFAIAIHGCIDGFSRKIIWLNAYSTNNDPRIVASYYIDVVDEAGGCPFMLRGDRKYN